MLGRNEGWVTTQGEILADRFVADGWEVRETSRQPRRLIRLIDTVWCLLRWHRGVDVVVLSVFSGPGFVMADVTSVIARLARLPVVMWLHGGNLPDFASQHPRWVRRVMARAAHVVAPSGFLAAGIADGDHAAEIIPNVVDLAAVPYRHRTSASPRLLWMRTFHPIYNPEMAVRVLHRVRRHHADATLTMAGQEKGLTEQVRALAASLGLADAVRFPGFLGPDDKAPVFDAHDIYLHTNHVDNTPVSVLEAAAAGLPVVATTVGGIPDLLEDGRTALLVPDDDDEASAAAVDRLIGDSELVSRLSANGHELAVVSDWAAVRKQWERVFDRVLGKG